MTKLRPSTNGIQALALANRGQRHSVQEKGSGGQGLGTVRLFRFGIHNLVRASSAVSWKTPAPGLIDSLSAPESGLGWRDRRLRFWVPQASLSLGDLGAI
jgi:hypothetical protein